MSFLRKGKSAGGPSERTLWSAAGSKLPLLMLAVFAFALVVNYWLMSVLSPAPSKITIPYTAFKEQVAAGNVKSIHSKGAAIEGRFAELVTWPPDATDDSSPSATSAIFETTLPAFVDSGLEHFLVDNGVEISALPIESGSRLTTFLFGFGPALLLIGFFVWMYRRQMQGSGRWAGFGKSKARRYDRETRGGVSFADVAGIDEAEDELVEIVSYLKDPAVFGRRCAEGSASGWSARHRQDATRSRCGRRGGRAFLLD